MGNRSVWAAFADASDGVVQAVRTQPNFRIQLLIAALALVAAYLLHLQFYSWCLVILTIGLVLAAELFNTCLEHVIDLIEPETHPLARSAKHAGAAAVLAASLVAAVVGALVYGQALASLLRQRG
jgi:diacylglycerol kinase